MKIAAICCTYKRPKELATAVECFLRQDYPAESRELIVLDDAGQYANQTGENWQLLSLPVRFRTLGEKRNATAALVSSDIDAYCVWDDDDIYLPWHMSAAVEALQDADYTIPTMLFTESNGALCPKENQCMFHGAWAFRREAFDRVGGYPFIQSGQDQGLLRRFKAAHLRRGDPIQIDSRPSYVYRWYSSHASHISAMGPNGYERLGEAPADMDSELNPGWDNDWIELAEQAIEMA